MIKDILGIALIAAMLCAAMHALPAVNIWARGCGAGITVQGFGGYWVQWQDGCTVERRGGAQWVKPE
jgi:hypothetical protein